MNEGAMVSIRLRYLIMDRDRHGNVRHYVRVPGRAKLRIREPPGTEAFLRAYEAAVGAIDAGAKLDPVGTFRGLCIRYFRSVEFSRLDASTRRWRQRALDRISVAKGHLPTARIEAKHVRRLRDELSETPGAANTRLKALKALFSWAVEAGLVHGNPAREVRLLRYPTAGHHAWTMDEIRKYEAQHPIGTKARLAMTLLLFTACRCEDAVRLGPQHIRGGRIQFTQAKNEHRRPIRIDLPLVDELRAAIDACKSGHLTFLTTEYGKPFSVKGFANKFKGWCREAGLAHCSAHGLRKAIATLLAEAGATPHEIMAVTGHTTLAEIERYTVSARRADMADGALKKLRTGDK